MANLKKSASLLIVDRDKGFVESLDGDPIASRFPPIIASTGKDAQLILADEKQEFLGVFVNPNITMPGGISVIRFAHLHHPAIPMFLIYDESHPYSDLELRQLGIQKAVQKPLDYTQIVNMVAPMVAEFEPGSALEIAKQNKDEIDVELTATDAQFIRIRAADFLSGSTSYFDIYVRLNSGRYLKILQAGDNFSPERVMSYLQKGVQYFYLRREAQEQYLTYCDKLADALLKKGSVPTEIKVTQTLNHGEETLKFFKERGIEDANLQYALRFINNINTLVKQLNPKKCPVLRSFLNDVSAYDHGAGTVLIGSLLAHTLNMTSVEPIETLGIACMFHDVGLKLMPPEFTDEDESKMSKDELILYRTHPVEGANLLKSVTGIKPAAIQAVIQHHERRNRKGFPFQLGPGSISLVAEIVGISDEFNIIIKRYRQDPSLDLNKEVEKKIQNCFSRQLIVEFRKIFGFNQEVSVSAPKSE